MSGQWEVVSKKSKPSKKAETNGKQPTITKEQSKLINNIRVEDVLPLSQLKSLYEPKVKENGKEKKKEVNNKSQVQKQKQNQSKKVPSDNKPKVFKSIETAFSAMKAEELNNCFENTKVVYPTMPLGWLRELAQYLNTHINVDILDVSFANKPDNYPLCMMPAQLRTVLEKALKQAGTENCNLFYDICLSSMANDMNKNQAAIGHKLFIQLLSQGNAKLALGNVQKFNALIKSYQFNPNVGMSVLWALGQGGFKDLQIGLQVFDAYMCPIIEMKHYTRFILNYLTTILKKHAKTSDVFLTLEDYFRIVDVAYGNSKKALSSEFTKELINSVPICNDLLLAANKGKEHTLIEPLLKKVGQTANKTGKQQLSEALVKSVLESERQPLMKVWESCHSSHLNACTVFVHYIELNWKSISAQSNSNQLSNLISVLDNTLITLGQSKQREDVLRDCQNVMRKLNNKMAGIDKKKTRSSKSRFIVYISLIFLGLFVYLDVQKHGGWSNSCTLQALNKTGVYKYTHKVYDRAAECTQWAHNHLEERFPGITETTIEYTSPYIELGRDLGLVFKNVAENTKEAVSAKLPVVINALDKYAPGLVEFTEELIHKVQKNSLHYYDVCHEFITTKVFVGKFAPEEIEKTLGTAYESAVKYSREYYHWIYSKITKAIH